MKKLLAILLLAGAAIFFFKARGATPSREVAAITLAPVGATAPQARPVATRAEPEAVSGASSLERANDFLQRHRDEWQVQPYHELRGEAYDSLIGSRVVYRAFQDGLPILGMEIEIDIDRDNRGQLVRNEYRPVKHIDVASLHVMPIDQILNQGSERFGASNNTGAPASVLYVSPQSDEPELAYAVTFHGKGPRAKGIQALVRATDGQLLARTASRTEF